MQVNTLKTQLARGSGQSWLVLRRNACTLRSIVNWTVAWNRRLITFLYKYWIHCRKVCYPGPAGRIKTFGRWQHKIYLLSQCSNQFPTNAKAFFSVLSKRVCPVFAQMQCKPSQGNLQSIKRHHMTEFQNELWLFLLKRITWKRRSGIQKMTKAHKCKYSSCHQPFVCIWSR